MENRIVDAREWLGEEVINSIGDHHWCDAAEDTHDDSVKIVDKLHKLGALKVEVEVYEDDEWAQTLVVTLPEDEETVRKILTKLGELFADEISERDGVCTVEWSG